jgi:peptide/nickel transport system permease protein
MITLLLRRAGLGLVTLFCVSLLVFAATQALPGDAAQAILGKTATPERLAALRAALHLNRPTLSQYLIWIGGVLRGDLGDSLATQGPVWALIAPRVGNSAFLVLLAAAFAVPASLVTGVVSAVWRDGPIDHALSAATLVLAAMPEFVIGITLVVLLAANLLHWFPAVSMLDDSLPPWRQLSQAVLPVATLNLAVIPYMSRIMRASMIEVMESEYGQMARLKGMPPTRVVWRHALPNAVVPFIQVTALQLAWLAGGIVLVEVVFHYPGIGQTLVDAVSNRDLPVVQALTLLVGAVYVGLNLVADCMTILLTPRLRTSLP